jgi:aspartyl-tRNA(Asn)/glutamyl-tRNA(Gln) amidotransferase subunit C
MALTPQEVAHVARLARLSLSEGELALMGHQLSNILDYIQMLQEVDVAGVSPTAQVTDLETVLRADTVVGVLPREAALSNAPDQSDGMFRVKAVLDL